MFGNCNCEHNGVQVASSNVFININECCVTGPTGPQGNVGVMGDQGNIGPTGPVGLFPPIYDLSAGVPGGNAFVLFGTGANVNAQSGGICLSGSTGHSGIVGLSTPVPLANPYRIRVYIQDFVYTISGEHSVCVGWTDGTKYQFSQLINGAYGTGIYSYVQNYSNYYTHNTTVFSANFGYSSDSMWFGLYDDGTNVYWQLSRDSVNYYNMYSIAKSSGYLANYDTAFWGVIDNEGELWIVTLRCWDTNGLNPIFPTSA